MITIKTIRKNIFTSIFELKDLLVFYNHIPSNFYWDQFLEQTMELLFRFLITVLIIFILFSFPLLTFSISHLFILHISLSFLHLTLILYVITSTCLFTLVLSFMFTATLAYYIIFAYFFYPHLLIYFIVSIVAFCDFSLFVLLTCFYFYPFKDTVKSETKRSYVSGSTIFEFTNQDKVTFSPARTFSNFSHFPHQGKYVRFHSISC